MFAIFAPPMTLIIWGAVEPRDEHPKTRLPRSLRTPLIEFLMELPAPSTDWRKTNHDDILFLLCAFAALRRKSNQTVSSARRPRPGLQPLDFLDVSLFSFSCAIGVLNIRHIPIRMVLFSISG